MSADVSTACTPGTRFASLVSMLMMRAWASGLIVNAAHSMLGSFMSAVYFCLPLTLSRPSTRISSEPRTASA